jgi:hypothetical protein
MAYEFQVTVDCADPHVLADWWAQTLGWQVEQQDEAFIRRMISEGYATDADTKRHNGALVWSGRVGHPRRRRRARQPDHQPQRRRAAGPRRGRARSRSLSKSVGR